MSNCLLLPILFAATAAMASTSGSDSGSLSDASNSPVTTPPSPPTPVPPTPAPPFNVSSISCVYPLAVPANADIDTLYWPEAEALAEVQRLQGLADYMDQEFGSRPSVLIEDSKVASAAWISNGCDSYDNSLCTGKGTPSPCCESTNSKYYSCDDQDGVDFCWFCEQPTAAGYKPEHCNAENFTGASVCGKDSAGNKVPAHPMVNLNPGSCSTGGEYKLELEEDDGVLENPIDPDVFYRYVANNWTNATSSDWGKKVLGWSIVTNAANATERAKVVVDGSLGLTVSYKPQNNGAFVIEGSCRTHFFAFHPINYATADSYGVYGGNATVVGATNNGGSIQTNTSGVIRMLNIRNNGGNVVTTDATDSFLGNVVSSGNVQFVAASAVTRLCLYNVVATAGTITASNGVSTLFYVETQTGVSVAIDQGNHQVWHAANAGNLSVSNCTSVTLYNVSNSGSVSAQCNSVTATMIRNSGTVNINAEGATLNLSFIENTGSVTITGNPVSASITVPAATTINVPGGVNVTYSGASDPATSSGSAASPQQGSSSGSGDVNVFDDDTTGNGCHMVSTVSAGLIALLVTLIVHF